MHLELFKKEDILSQSNQIKKKIFSVDYYFCFNEAIGKQFKSLLKCSVVPIGSFRSNFYKRKKNKKNMNLPISQYTDIIQKLVQKIKYSLKILKNIY